MRCASCGQFIPGPIKHPNVLLCEGPSDAAFFRALMQARGGFFVDVRTPKMGVATGRSGMGKALRALRLHPGFEQVTKVVIAVDCDTSLEDGFEHVRSQIAELAADTNKAPGERQSPVPSEPNALFAGDPSLAILMIPPAASAGGLEDLIFATAPTVNPQNAKAVEALAEAAGVNAWPPQKRAKMKVRSFVACTHAQMPDVSIGNLWQEGNNSAYLVPLQHAVFDPLVNQLRQLF